MTAAKSLKVIGCSELAQLLLELPHLTEVEVVDTYNPKVSKRCL